MRLAIAQMGMSASIDENLRKTLDLMERAKAARERAARPWLSL